MPGLYNRGKKILSDGSTVWASADIRCALVTSSYTFNADHNFVSELTNELSGGSYARVALGSKTVTEDDTNDRVAIDAADVVFPALGAAAGTPARAVVYKYNAADSSAELIACLDLTSPPAPNGGDYTITWPATGIALLT